MISITTKRGDKGQTSLRDGSRVSKDDARVELNGELDELNALLGLCKAQTGLQQPFEDIQLQLMDFMTVIADNCTEPDAERIARLTEAPLTILVQGIAFILYSPVLIWPMPFCTSHAPKCARASVDFQLYSVISLCLRPCQNISIDFPISCFA